MNEVQLGDHRYANMPEATPVRHVSPPTRPTKTANERYKNAAVLTSKLASLAAEEGGVVYQERTEALQTLINLWQD